MHLVCRVLENLLDFGLVLLCHVLQVQLVILILVVKMVNDLMADGRHA